MDVERRGTDPDAHDTQALSLRALASLGVSALLRHPWVLLDAPSQPRPGCRCAWCSSTGKSMQDLLTTALHRLSERGVQHWQASLAVSDDDPCHALRSLLVSSLPLDEEPRAFHRFGVSQEQLAIGDEPGIRAI